MLRLFSPSVVVLLVHSLYLIHRSALHVDLVLSPISCSFGVCDPSRRAIGHNRLVMIAPPATSPPRPIPLPCSAFDSLSFGPLTSSLLFLLPRPVGGRHCHGRSRHERNSLKGRKTDSRTDSRQTQDGRAFDGFAFKFLADSLPLSTQYRSDLSKVLGGRRGVCFAGIKATVCVVPLLILNCHFVLWTQPIAETDRHTGCAFDSTLDLDFLVRPRFISGRLAYLRSARSANLQVE